jgi:hypothetical protein
MLAVYALFVVLPAVHLLQHGHVGGAVPMGPADGAAYLVAACNDGCQNPFHQHTDHAADSTCAVCQTLGSARGLPQLAEPACVAGPPVGLVVSTEHRLRTVADVRVAMARGPPDTLAPRFETIVA